MADLTTIENVRLWLTSKASAFSTVSDDLLARLITSCSAYVQSWLNREILLASYAETYSGKGTTRLELRQYPVQAVTAVSVDGVAIQARPALGTLSASTIAGFVYDEVAVMLVGYRFTRGMQNVVVSYSAGYDAVPADVEQAVTDIIGDWFKYRDRIGVTVQAIEQQSTSFVNTPMPARAKDVLAQYRNVRPIL